MRRNRRRTAAPRGCFIWIVRPGRSPTPSFCASCPPPSRRSGRREQHPCISCTPPRRPGSVRRRRRMRFTRRGQTPCLTPSRCWGSDRCLTRRKGGEPAAKLWEALVHPGQKLKPGARVVFDRRRATFTARSSSADSSAAGSSGCGPTDGSPRRRRRRRASATCRCRRTSSATIAPADRERYQTVFARARGSVAAPTAGLHFTPALARRARARAASRSRAITLHVGYGTFQPVRVERVEEHRLEPERYEIVRGGRRRDQRARSTSGRRVIAVGTTTTRTLEAVARRSDGRIVAGRGRDRPLHLSRASRSGCVGGLLTNFHLPQSSLLMLVSAFAGRERVLAAYREAVAQRLPVLQLRRRDADALNRHWPVR